jgi:hypothetical protein
MASNSRSFVLLWFLPLITGASLPAADHNVSIAGAATRSQNDQWKWTVFLKGSAEAIGHVRCVHYTLQGGFPDPSRNVCERGSPDQPFATSGVTWGSFSLSATVVFDDRTTAQLSYNLNPQAVAQATGVIGGRWHWSAKGLPARERHTGPAAGSAIPWMSSSRGRLIMLWWATVRSIEPPRART